jgi:hypothetical protein
MKIIYPFEDGLAVLFPVTSFMNSLPSGWSEGDKLVHLANKDISTGISYEIVEDDQIPGDEFRNAWEYVAGENEQVSEDLSLDDQLKYNHITQDEFDAANS